MRSKRSKTAHGTTIIEWTDDYGANCSLQESSSLNKPAIWLGSSDIFHHKPTNTKSGTRMNMNRRQVKVLVTRLLRWLNTGKL